MKMGEPAWNKGKEMSEETRARMSQSHIGKTNAIKGHTFEEFYGERAKEIKEKQSKSITGEKNHFFGKTHTTEVRRIISAANKGKIGPNRGKTFSEETKKRISEAKKGKHRAAHKAGCNCCFCKTWNKGKGEYLSPDVRIKVNEGRRLYLEKNGSVFKGQKHTEKANEKNRLAHLGKRMSSETKQKMKDVWKNPEYREKRAKIFFDWMARMEYFPNKKEMELFEMLQVLYPNEWKYVGNGYTWIGGKNPDFLNVNGKKSLIEFFGDYWHKGDDGENRVAHFAKYGFKTLIIRECELKDKKVLTEKLNNFMEAI